MINLGLKLGFILKGLTSIASTFNNSKLWIVTLIIVCLSVGVEWYGRACGFILTSDSLQYLSAARSFSEQGKFLSPDGTYYSYWQPLFPMILSVSSKPLMLVGWINLFCKISIGLVLLSIANTFFKTLFFKTVFLSASLLSVYIVMISIFVWSDLLFMALAYINLYVAFNLEKRNYFILLLITGFLMCIQRNAGLFWIGGICFWLSQDKEMSLQRNLLRTTLFFLVSTSGLWIWNVYNTFFIPTNFSFYKHSFFGDAFYNSILVAKTYARMIVPGNNEVVLLAFFFLAVALLMFFLVKNFNRLGYLLVCILLVYSAGYVAMVKLDAYEMDRYLSIVAPLVYLLFLKGLEWFIQSAPKWVRFGVISLTIIWVGYPISRTIKNLAAWHDRSCFSDSSK